MMNRYEMIYIIDTGLEETARKELIEKVSALISANGGEIEKVDETWGKRRLAYAIDYKTEGWYVLVTFKAPAELPRELERNLQINENVLRYLVVKLEEKRSSVKPRPVRQAAPAEAAPAAALNNENPFRLVADETVVTETAPAENTTPEEQFDIKVFAKLVQSDVSSYKTALNEYRFNKKEGQEEPKLTFSDETKAYADKYSLDYVELDMMDVNALAEQPIAQAMGFNEVMMKKIFTCVEAEDLRANYVVWKSEVEDAAVAELTDEVKKVVAETWKLEKAKELAAAAAADMAKAAAESKTLTNPITVENFAQYAMTAQGPMPTDLALYEDQLNNITEEFRANVFKMVPGEVKAMGNRNRSIQYVVLLKSYAPDDAELRAMFQNIKENPQYSQSMFMMGNYETINAIQRWEMSVFEDAGASFVESSDPYAE